MRASLLLIAVLAAVGLATVDRGHASPGATVTRHLLGRSVDGRPLWAVEVGNRHSRRKVVVIGCIDGNEPAGIAIARALETVAAPAGTDLWIVEDINPDGVHANTLQNADGVDLNRNFPWHWRQLGHRGYWQYSGRRALSEPESRAMRLLLVDLAPRLVIWYHQPLGVVDQSGGRIGLERRYAQLVGLRLVRLTRYPGSATSWADHRFRGATSFVVELPPGRLTVAAVQRHVHGVLALARSLP